MALFTPADRRKAELVSGLVYCNPFRGERIELERGVLGDEFDEGRVDWNVHPDWKDVPGEDRLRAHAQELAERARNRLKEATSAQERMGIKNHHFDGKKMKMGWEK